MRLLLAGFSIKGHGYENKLSEILCGLLFVFRINIYFLNPLRNHVHLSYINLGLENV